MSEYMSFDVVLTFECSVCVILARWISFSYHWDVTVIAFLFWWSLY